MAEKTLTIFTKEAGLHQNVLALSKKVSFEDVWIVIDGMFNGRGPGFEHFEC